MRRTYVSAWICIILVLALSGCNFTQSAFARMADTISGAFSAASTTLTYFHTNKLTYVYTTSSFENYASELNGLDQKLPSQTGAPEHQKIQQLLVLYQPAMQALEHPCLESSCQWHEQVAAIDRASKAFQEASNT